MDDRDFAAEVFRQLDGLRFGIPIFEGKNIANGSPSEPIDALVVITNYSKMLAATGYEVH